MNKRFQTREVTAITLACGLLTTVGTTSILRAAPPQGTTPQNKKAAKTTKAVHPKSGTAKPTDSSAVGDNTPLTEDQRILHVLNRLGFGPRPGDLENVRRIGLTQYIDLQLQPENIDESAVENKLEDLTSLKASSSDLAEQYIEQRRLGRDIRRIIAQAKQEQDAKLASNTPGGVLTVDQTVSADAGKMTDPKMMDTKPGDTKMDTPETPATMEVTKAGLRRQVYDRMTPEEKDALGKLLEQRQNMQKNGNAPALELTAAKVIRAVDSPRQLQEVLADFWNNHFNIDIRKNQCRVYKISDDRDVIRPHMLGKFRDLLGADAKSPAMLVYLDNYQSSVPQKVNPRFAARRLQLRGTNRPNMPQGQIARVIPTVIPPTRGGINENYAREIMELHTLGVDGGYTQKDVTEVARCLTGWGIRQQTGEFFFDPRRHDDGEKIVLGHRIPAGGGIQDGETVLDILASNPSTMRFISTKLCKRFVSDNPPASLVNRCVQTWQRTDGNLREVVRTIVTSPEFFSRAAYRQKIKSPFEYAVSAIRALGGTINVENQPMQLAGLKKGYNSPRLAQSLIGQISTMGEPLFQCQPPTGYSEDSHKWVSTGALISRLNFSLLLTSGRMQNIDISAAHNLVPGTASPQAEVNDLATALLHGEVTPSTRATLLRQVTVPVAPGEEKVGTRRIAALVLGSPEFQRR